MRLSALDRLRKPEGRVLEGGRGRAAVVAVLNLEEPSDPEILFVVRRISSRDLWSGEVAFPGGMWMEGDRDILETAARELWEETGMRLGEDAKVLGVLDEVAPSNMPQLKVTPFLAEAKGRPRIKLGEELASYFWARASSLEPTEKIRRDSNGGYRVFPGFRYSAWVIWGVTGRILKQILELLGRRF